MSWFGGLLAQPCGNGTAWMSVRQETWMSVRQERGSAMRLTVRRSVVMVAALALVFGLSSEAGATAYGFSMMSVSGLTVTFNPNQPFSCPNCDFSASTSAQLTGFAPAGDNPPGNPTPGNP